MKLVFCSLCHDIFNLRLHSKSCSCENITAKYLEDGLQAEIIVKERGTAWPIGFANESFFTKLAVQSRKVTHSQKFGDRFEAFFIPLLASTISIFQGEHREKFEEGQRYLPGKKEET